MGTWVTVINYVELFPIPTQAKRQLIIQQPDNPYRPQAGVLWEAGKLLLKHTYTQQVGNNNNNKNKTERYHFPPPN